MYDKIKDAINISEDFDSMMYSIDDIIDRYRTHLSIEQIRMLCDCYFRKNETPEQLQLSNRLFEELDHRMNMLN